MPQNPFMQGPPEWWNPINAPGAPGRPAVGSAGPDQIGYGETNLGPGAFSGPTPEGSIGWGELGGLIARNGPGLIGSVLGNMAVPGLGTVTNALLNRNSLLGRASRYGSGLLGGAYQAARGNIGAGDIGTYAGLRGGGMGSGLATHYIGSSPFLNNSFGNSGGFSFANPGQGPGNSMPTGPAFQGQAASMFGSMGGGNGGVSQGGGMPGQVSGGGGGGIGGGGGAYWGSDMGPSGVVYYSGVGGGRINSGDWMNQWMEPNEATPKGA